MGYGTIGTSYVVLCFVGPCPATLVMDVTMYIKAIGNSYDSEIHKI
jgi:hypothetical protein